MCLVGNKRADIARVIPCKNNFCTKFAHRFHFCGLQKLNTLNLRLFHPPLNPCNHFPTVLIKTNWYTISYKFEDCSGLTSITIPSSVTSLGKRCFYGCSGLTSITIPSSVTSLSSECFLDCPKLEKAIFQGYLPRYTIYSGLQSTCIIYVPKAYLQDYKDALGSKYSYIYALKDSESGEQKPEQCAVPTISYAVFITIEQPKLIRNIRV